MDLDFRFIIFVWHQKTGLMFRSATSVIRKQIWISFLNVIGKRTKSIFFLFRCTYKKYWNLLLPNKPCLPVVAIGSTFKQKNTPDYKPNPLNVLKWKACSKLFGFNYYEVRSDKSLLNHLTKMYIPTDVTNMYIPTEKRKRKIKCYLLIP